MSSRQSPVAETFAELHPGAPRGEWRAIVAQVVA